MTILLRGLRYYPLLQRDDVCPRCRNARLTVLTERVFEDEKMCPGCYRKAKGDIYCIAINSGRNRGLVHVWNWWDWPERTLKSRGYWKRLMYFPLYWRAMTDREREYLKNETRNVARSYADYDALREYEFSQGRIDPKLDTSFNYTVLRWFEEQPKLDAELAAIRKRKRQNI